MFPSLTARFPIGLIGRSDEMSFDIDAILRMGAAGEPKQRQETESELSIAQLSVLELAGFPSSLHKFKPATAKRMEELVESIRINGIINPLIIRKLSDGTYQIIAGHNRRTAAVQLGYKTVPCIIKTDLSDDDAISIMVADNLHNRELLPSERGWSYRQLMEVNKRQGQRSDLTSTGPLSKFRTNEEVGKHFNVSREKVRSYIRLTYLIDPLLDLVDSGKIGLGTGEQLSYLKKPAQETVFAFCYASEPSHPLKEAQARTLREIQADPDRIIDDALLEELTTNQKKVRFRTLKIEMSKLREYFPTGTPEEVVLQTIHTALSVYFSGKNDDSPQNSP